MTTPTHSPSQQQAASKTAALPSLRAAAARHRRIALVAFAGTSVLVLGATAWGFMSRGTQPGVAVCHRHRAAGSPMGPDPRRQRRGCTLAGGHDRRTDFGACDVAVGDVVRRGQLLARFDTATVRAEEAQLLAALSQAQGVAAQADANRDPPAVRRGCPHDRPMAWP